MSPTSNPPYVVHLTYAGNDILNHNDLGEVVVYVVMDSATNEAVFATLDLEEANDWATTCDECGYSFDNLDEGCDTCASFKVDA